MSGSPKLSIVTTLYQSAPYVQEFFDRASKAGGLVTPDFELVFVNDGSPDDSLDKVKTFLDSHVAIQIVNLSRNFGHHKALMTGLQHAKGDLIFLVDCDLEEVPELLQDFHKTLLLHPDHDVVYGVQKKRPGSVTRRLSGAVFYKVFNLFADIKIPENLCVVRLMSRRYVNALLTHTESEIMIGGLWARTGFSQLAMPIEKTFKGSSTYTLGRQLSLTIHSIVSFTTKPLTFLFWMGFFVSLLSTGFALAIVVRKMLWGIPVPGFASLLVSVWLLGGLIIAALGLLGIYLGVIFREVKGRPLTIVQEVYTNSKS